MTVSREPRTEAGKIRLADRILMMLRDPHIDHDPLQDVTRIDELLREALPADVLRENARRYERLQLLGAAPGGSRELDAGTVLRYNGLDDFVDADLRVHPDRGEYRLAVTDATKEGTS